MNRRPNAAVIFGQALTFDALLQRAAALPYAMPTEANHLASLTDLRREVEEHARGTRPLLHARVARALDAWLELKRATGSPVERALYAGMDRVALVDRLLRCRPLAFLNPSDSYLLRDGHEGSGGFEQIGAEGERPPLLLATLQSYDEMALSALLGVSVPTHFINRGDRGNAGRPAASGSFEPRGVYVGLVGARFERPRRMEWQQLVVEPEQNTAALGYGADAEAGAPLTRLCRLWAHLHGVEHLPLYEEAARAPDRFLPLGGGRLLDAELYRQRLRLSVEPFLCDANLRARRAGRRAYVHLVGLGLGVWAVHPAQAELQVQVYHDVLRQRRLEQIADLDFSWFGGASRCGDAGHDELLRLNGNRVRIHFSRRDPAAPLQGDDQGKLLVAQYAWDSNAFPGNEYWAGALTASGDPAAACCSTIPLLQNVDVNPYVCGANTLVWGDGRSTLLGELPG